MNSKGLDERTLQSMPMYEDGMGLWFIIHKYVTNYLDLFYLDENEKQGDSHGNGDDNGTRNGDSKTVHEAWKPKNMNKISIFDDSELIEYWNDIIHPKKNTGWVNLPVLTRANLIDQLTYFIFSVSAKHELCGSIIEYFANSDTFHIDCGSKIIAEQSTSDLDSTVMILCLLGLTSKSLIYL
jgi:hypothetical protein